MNNPSFRTVVPCPHFLFTLPACQADSAKSPAVKTEPPAKLSGTAVKEAELTSISLTEDAEKRLGIRIEEARAGRGSARRKFAGEVTAPLGSTVLVSSPVAGTLQARGPIPSVGSPIKKDQPLFSLMPFLPLPRDLKSHRRRRRRAGANTCRNRPAAQGARRQDAGRRSGHSPRPGRSAAGTRPGDDRTGGRTESSPSSSGRSLRRRPPNTNSGTSGRHAPSGLRRVRSNRECRRARSLRVTNLAEIWIRVPVYAGEAQELASNAPVTVQAINMTGQIVDGAACCRAPIGQSHIVHCRSLLPSAQ